jgi:hypothetical protein
MNNFADPAGSPLILGGEDWGDAVRNTEQSVFWRAFWTGLASATCLYAEPPAPYWTAVLRFLTLTKASLRWGRVSRRRLAPRGAVP